MSVNPDIAFKARRAAVVISRNLDKINWDMSLESSGSKVDDKLICIAKRDNLTLVTNDVYLKVKSIIKGVSNKGYGGGDEYAGIRYWDIDCEDGHSKELEDAIQEHKIPCCLENLNENEYVIARNKNSVITRKNGEKTYEFLHSFVYRNNVFQPLTNNYKNLLNLFDNDKSLYVKEIIKGFTNILDIESIDDSLKEKYRLEAEEKDIPFLIALVIAIDNIVDNRHRQ